MTNSYFNDAQNSGIARRDFMKGGLAALIVPIVLGESASVALAGNPVMSGYIEIAVDNTVTLYIGQSEMGQGIMTGLAQVMAEELKVKWTDIRVVHGGPNSVLFGGQVTGGSRSMINWYSKLSSASALAREKLKKAASVKSGVAVGSVVMANGVATCGTTSHTYGTLVADAALIPDSAVTATITGTKQFVGQSIQRVDIPAKVNGSAVFGIDVRVPNMVYAAVQHSPVIGGTTPASLPGVPSGAIALVDLGNAVAVVANNTWSAMKSAEALNVSWVVPAESASIDSAIEASKSQSLISSTDLSQFNLALDAVVGSPDSVAASMKVDSIYQMPHLAHAALEPLNCTVNLTDTMCEIWAPTQAPQWVANTVKALTGLSDAQITVNTTFLGGGFGRKIEQDYIAQAIKIAQAVKLPVKLTWSRKQDFQNDRYRPSAVIRVRAGLDSAGTKLNMIYRNVSSSIAEQAGNPESTGPIAGITAYKSPGKGMAYAVANKRVEFAPNNVKVPLGYWRSVGESYNIFALECAIDELAAATGKTPLALRQNLLSGKTRELAVLNAVVTLAGSTPSGTYRGISFINSFGSIAAVIAEISVNATTGVMTPKRFFCAIDCGVAVNPNQIEGQVQSAVVMGTSAAMWQEAKFAAGKSTLSNFNSYRMMKLREMPVVTTKIIASTAAVGGVGETVVPIVAPALANAYFAAKGVRLRSLPFYPGSTMGGL